MQPPDHNDQKYQPLYEEGEEAPGYQRYADDMRRYHEANAAATTVVHALMAAEQLRTVGEENFTEALRDEHRTHQQGAARMLRLLLLAMAEMDYDDRNAGMVDFARLALKATERVRLPFV